MRGKRLTCPARRSSLLVRSPTFVDQIALTFPACSWPDLRPATPRSRRCTRWCRATNRCCASAWLWEVTSLVSDRRVPSCEMSRGPRGSTRQAPPRRPRRAECCVCCSLAARHAAMLCKKVSLDVVLLPQSSPRIQELEGRLSALQADLVAAYRDKSRQAEDLLAARAERDALTTQLRWGNHLCAVGGDAGGRCR